MKRGSPGFDEISRECQGELARGAEREAGVHLLCMCLKRRVPVYRWVGVYLVVPGEDRLVLGPFSGAPTERLRVPFGCGAVGRAARDAKTDLTNDLDSMVTEPLFADRRCNEIAVPVRCSSKDEPRTARFSTAEPVIAVINVAFRHARATDCEDQRLLEELACAVEPHIPRIPQR